MDDRRRTRGIILSAAFCLSLVMGAGPGIALANRPTSFAGIPLLYAWGLLWFLVEVTLVLLMYFFVWSDADEEG